MLRNKKLVENVDEEIMVTTKKKPETKFEEYLLGLLGKEFFDSQYQWIKRFEIENGEAAIEAFNLEICEEYTDLGYILSVATRQKVIGEKFIADVEDTFPF